MGLESTMHLEEGLSEFILSMIGTMGANMLSFAVSVLAYVLFSLGLYTIAQRRQIKNPWMAWVPVLRLWILGSISDQYRYVARGQVRSRRKVLLITSSLQVAAWITTMVLLIVMIVRMAMDLSGVGMMEQISDKQMMEIVLKAILPVGISLAVMCVIAIVHVVLYCMACADLFASCEPENRTVYLVLGILISVTMYVFVFICRNKDLGMPPRRQPTPEIE